MQIIYKLIPLIIFFTGLNAHGGEGAAVQFRNQNSTGSDTTEYPGAWNHGICEKSTSDHDRVAVTLEKAVSGLICRPLGTYNQVIAAYDRLPLQVIFADKITQADGTVVFKSPSLLSHGKSIQISATDEGLGTCKLLNFSSSLWGSQSPFANFGQQTNGEEVAHLTADGKVLYTSTASVPVFRVVSAASLDQAKLKAVHCKN